MTEENRDGYDPKVAKDLADAINAAIKPGTMTGTVVGALAICLAAALVDHYDPDDPKDDADLKRAIATIGADTILFMRRMKQFEARQSRRPQVQNGEKDK